MRHTILATGLTITLLACTSDSVHAIPITGGAGFTGTPTVINFEGRIEAELIDTQYSGVVFSQDDGGRPQIDEDPIIFFGPPAAYDQVSGTAVLTGSLEGMAPFEAIAGIIVEFNAPVAEAGAFVSDLVPLDDYVITARNSADVVLETLTIMPADFPGAGGLFAGFSRASNDIKSIQFGPSDYPINLNAQPGLRADAFAIDDLQYSRVQNAGGGGDPNAIPEPSTFVLTVFGALALCLRKKRIRQR